MTALHCFRIRDKVGDRSLQDLSGLVDQSERAVEFFGPYQGDGFVAALAFSEATADPPPWVDFVRSAFDEVRVGPSSSVSAVLFVAVTVGKHRPLFAFTFGMGGRFLLPDDVYERNFGLRTALNIVYPRVAGADDPARLKAWGSKRRAEGTVREERQASRGSTLDAFDVDRVREIVSSAYGIPHHEQRWGRRIGGSDPLHLAPRNMTFAGLGQLCIDLEDAWRRDDYRDRFEWIDNIRPVTDPALINELEEEVTARLRAGTIAEFDLAPPEVIDLAEVDGFRYHFDPRPSKKNGKMVRDEVRLSTYLAGLGSRLPEVLSDLTADYLGRVKITAVDGDGRTKKWWSVWRCLTGELQRGDDVFILDEGEFFSVAASFHNDLNTFVDAVPESAVPLSDSKPLELEGTYNARVANELGFISLDADLVRLTGETGVEVCDLLCPDRRLIHVKRGLRSSTLSHLFAQGVVSADLLQVRPEFRVATAAKVAPLDPSGACTFFGPDDISTSDFEIVYAVIAKWNGRTLAQALPFFSKLNFRYAVEFLQVRGYRVGHRRVNVA